MALAMFFKKMISNKPFPTIRTPVRSVAGVIPQMNHERRPLGEMFPALVTRVGFFPSVSSPVDFVVLLGGELLGA